MWTAGDLRKWSGVIPPTVTPLSDDGSVDRKGLQRVIEFQLAQDVTAVFLLGSAGEFAGLTYRQRMQVVEAGVEIVNRRVPVFVGVSAEGTAVAVDLARQVACLGADALVSTPPFYYLYERVEHPVCLEFFLRLMEATDLPLFAYNNPRLARTSIPVETLVALIEQEKFAGLKESSADLRLFQRMLQVAAGKVTILQGNGRLVVASAAIGARGGVHATANLLAEEYRWLWDQASRRGEGADWQKVLDLQFRLATVDELVLNRPSPYSILKGVLERLGLCRRWVTSPFPQATDQEVDAVCSALGRLGFWEALQQRAEVARSVTG